MESNRLATPNLRIPALYDYRDAVISWSAVPGATGYQLERRFDKTFGDNSPGATWSDIQALDLTWNEFDALDKTWDQLEATVPVYDYVIYTGPSTSFTDTMLGGAKHVTYRLTAFAENVKTWDQLDALGYTWDQIDALGLSWWQKSSVYTTVLLPIDFESTLKISDYDRDLGIFGEARKIEFSISDPDRSYPINVTVYLNSTLIYNQNNITVGRTYTAIMTDAQFNTLGYGSSNTITITATGDRGDSKKRIFTFRKYSHTHAQAIYYLYRDGVPVRKLPGRLQWYDFIDIGRHDYFIRAIYGNIAIDSNTVTLDIQINYATIATMNDPESFTIMMLRRDEPPQKSYRKNNGMIEERYIGLEYPRFRNSGQKTMQMTVAYTTTNLQEYNSLKSVLESSETLVYRDHFGNRIVGIVDDASFDYFGKLDAENNFIADYVVSIMQSAYDEEVYFD